MKWFTPLMLAAMLSRIGRTAQHDKRPLVAHGKRKEAGYPVLRIITQEIELIPVESLNQCEAIGNKIMKSGKLTNFFKRYKCIPGIFERKAKK